MDENGNRIALNRGVGSPHNGGDHSLCSDWDLTADVYCTNMTIATGIYFSSALMECVSTGAKGVFYDYPNLRSIETELYSWGKNKVIFSDTSKMMLELKAYKTDSRSNPDLGDWSNHLETIDPFRDGRGGERIGNYIAWLQKGFEYSLECDTTIGRANQKYADAWGEDKLYSRKYLKAK